MSIASRGSRVALLGFHGSHGRRSSGSNGSRGVRWSGSSGSHGLGGPQKDSQRAPRGPPDAPKRGQSGPEQGPVRVPRGPRRCVTAVTLLWGPLGALLAPPRSFLGPFKDGGGGLKRAVPGGGSRPPGRWAPGRRAAGIGHAGPGAPGGAPLPPWGSYIAAVAGAPGRRRLCHPSRERGQGGSGGAELRGGGRPGQVTLGRGRPGHRPSILLLLHPASYSSCILLLLHPISAPLPSSSSSPCLLLPPPSPPAPQGTRGPRAFRGLLGSPLHSPLHSPLAPTLAPH